MSRWRHNRLQKRLSSSILGTSSKVGSTSLIAFGAANAAATWPEFQHRLTRTACLQLFRCHDDCRRSHASHQFPRPSAKISGHRNRVYDNAPSPYSERCTTNPLQTDIDGNMKRSKLLTKALVVRIYLALVVRFLPLAFGPVSQRNARRFPVSHLRRSVFVLGFGASCIKF